MTSSPTQYNFNNDLSRGNFTNSLQREQHLKKVEHIKLNHNLSVDGTSQTSTGGIWVDVGSPNLHTGHAQRMASSVNADLAYMMAQYPVPDDSEPEWNPLPNVADNIVKAANVTAESKITVELPSIKTPKDIPLWIAAWIANLTNQIIKLGRINS